MAATAILIIADLVSCSLSLGDPLKSGDESTAFIGSTPERKVMSSRCEATSPWTSWQPDRQTLWTQDPALD
jgi:hypothetical protein